MDIAAHPAIDVTTISTQDLEAMLAILEKYEPDAAEPAAAGELEIGSSAIAPASKLACLVIEDGDKPRYSSGRGSDWPRTGPYRARSAWLREMLLAFKTGQVW
jgi:hypothetical protein